MRTSKIGLPSVVVVVAAVAALSAPAQAPAAPLAASSSTAAAAAASTGAPTAASATPTPTRSPETERLDAEARAPATEVRVAPSSRGTLGAWLVAGPWRAARFEAEGEARFSESLGHEIGTERDFPAGARRRAAPARWEIASSSDAPIDVKGALEATGSDLIGLAAGRLHVEHAGKYLLLLAVDDGVRVSVDGAIVYARDEARPLRDDDDVVPLDLDAGDHEVVLQLHQRDGAWAFRARFVDRSLTPPPGAYLALAGTTDADARDLAAKMAEVSLDRGFDPSAGVYAPKLTVRFPAGAPRGVAIPVSAALVAPDEAEPVFDVVAGGVPVTSAGAGELVVSLPRTAPLAKSGTLTTTVAGRFVKSNFFARRDAEQALVRATKALAKTPEGAPWLPAASRESVAFLAERLESLVAKGDWDAEAQADEARELDKLAAALEQKSDPYEGKTGPMRRAIRSRLDGKPTEFGLYVPPWYRASGTRKFPLVVGLHGLNGYPLGILRWMFGGDDPKRDQAWEDRHVGALQPVDTFILTPAAHGNTLYRELGEDDVMQLVAWAMKTFPIDPTRVTITGPSMGGIGSAAIPFHHPHVFAAAEPLCGYHSYLIRGDVAGHPIRPWERFLAEERSNVLWAENGEHLPLFIVHGTKDLPEENSGVLIDRYERLNFSVKHEHPDSGHNVWQETYEDLEGMKWLLNRRLDLHPAHVRFKTTRTRWQTSAWLTVDEMAAESGWADVDARVRGKTKITLTSRGVSALTLARDEKLLDPTAAITVTADGQALAFDEDEALVLHREGTTWRKGPATHAGAFKHGTVTGPIRDVFNEPILFVYAAGAEARANEEVARAFGKIRWGVSIDYPMMSDDAFLETKEPLANDRALFLVGRGNKVLAALEKIAPMPIHVEDGVVSVGAQRFTGKELGAAFVRPNPARPDRYVVVVAGADVTGTLRAMSLPDLLPDFVVWDAALTPSRGRVLLDRGAVRAGGFFTKDWALPASIVDPLAKGASSATGEAASRTSKDEGE